MKLYPHEIRKTLQEKQNVKLSPCKKHKCSSNIKFLNNVAEKYTLCLKLLESQILGRNLKDVSTECKSEK